MNGSTGKAPSVFKPLTVLSLVLMLVLCLTLTAEFTFDPLCSVPCFRMCYVLPSFVITSLEKKEFIALLDVSLYILVPDRSLLV